jgi:hypothetical protein
MSGFRAIRSSAAFEALAEGPGLVLALDQHPAPGGDRMLATEVQDCHTARTEERTSQ